ncbi:MAG TPA: PPOX class F420-dependent oxidoreductase [Streptosporangiaceae bacterium]
MTSESISEDIWAREGAAQRFGGKYLSLASYKRDGTLVATPVWFVEQDGRLLVETDACSGKVKRIRRDPAVRIAPCTATGRLRGDQVPGFARLLPDSEIAAVERLIKRKYWADLIVIAPLRLIQSCLHIGRTRSAPVIVSITPSSVSLRSARHAR